mgnify:CR=1 FL=1
MAEVLTDTVIGSISVVMVWVLPYGGLRAVQDWAALMLYELICVLDFCKLKMPDTVFPFAVLSDSADGNALSNGVKEPLGGGGGGVVVEGGGGGGVVDGGGGGGVVEVGGGGGGGVVPVAVTLSATGMRRVCEPLGPLSTI